MDDETEFEAGIDDTVACCRCGRVRPFPKRGKLLLHEEGAALWVIDTRIQCGDGGLGCQDTRVKVMLKFEF